MNFRIAIVGSGAIGSYYGAKLAHGGSDVHFLIRGDLSEIRREGFSVHGKGENFRVAKVNCYNSTEEIGRCDLVLIAVKATSNADLVDLVDFMEQLAPVTEHGLVFGDLQRQALVAVQLANELGLGLGTVVLLAIDVREDTGNLTVYVERFS